MVPAMFIQTRPLNDHAQGGRFRTPDDGLARDPYYRFDAPHPMLIRITGGQRAYTSGNLTTFYSWTLAYHPQDTADNSRPADVQPATWAGPKNNTINPGVWTALEASGNDTVPTDGSAVVLAVPSPSQDFLIFHYEREILGEIVAKKTTGSTTWYTWKEVEPGALNSAGITFDDKPAQALTGTEETGPLLRNPLFEINQRSDIPAGTIVRVFRYPVRVDTAQEGGYLREKPEAIVTETQHADATGLLSTVQDVTWYGATGGSYKLRITNAAGTVGTSNAINFGDNAAAIDAAIVASGVVTNVTIVGDGESFTVQFDDTYTHVPPVEIVENDTNNMWADTPYFFDAGLAQKFDKSANTPTDITGPINAATIYVYTATGVTLGEHSGSSTKGLRLLAATKTQQGTVSTTDQLVAGRKCVYASDFYLTDNNAFEDFDVDTLDSGLNLTIASGGTAIIGVSTSSGDNIATGLFFADLGTDYNAYWQLESNGLDTSVPTNVTLTGQIIGTNAACVLEGFGTASPALPHYSVVHNSTRYDGATGAVAGLEFKGGLTITIPADLTYTPTTSSDWNGAAPTTIKAALDRCAALLKTLNGGTGP